MLGRHLLRVSLLWLACGCCPPHVAESPSSPWFTEKVSGEGTPVVFLSDLEAPADVWDTTVAHLHGRVEAHLVGIAGFAGVPAVSGPVIPALRDALARHLRATGKRRVILVGHMFGATIAYSLALSDPDLIAGVVAVDALPTVGDGDPKDVAAGAEEGRHDLATASPEQFATMTNHRIASMMASPEIAARISAEAVHSSPQSVAEAFYEMMTLDLRPRLGEFRAPVLVIATMGNQKGVDRGEFDARWHRQVDLIPHHTFVVVPASKHYVMFDEPETFFDALDRFLAQTP
jgi:N-formylmaleamate deformylase